MIKISKINVSILDKNDVSGDSRLEFKISGGNINYVIINTLRRTIFSDIPIYAFNIFKFEKNTSIFHNNYLKLRLQHMPVWSIKNTIDFIKTDSKLNEKMTNIQEDEDEDDENTVDMKQDDNIINSSSLNQLTMYVNYKNKTNEIMCVTTSHAKFYYDEKQISSPYKNECQIVKLQPGQEISFSTVTKLGCEKEDTLYTAVNIVTYKQINDNEFNFCLESKGQITEKRILQVALLNIEKNMINFLNIFLQDVNKSEKDLSDEEGLIIVHNEDHTLGNLISRGMQLHSKVTFAGYNLPHPLSKKVHFHYQLEKDGNIKKIMKEVVEYYSEIFSNINKEINKF
jgi:DNA-directed RNA polymerase subunit L